MNQRSPARRVDAPSHTDATMAFAGMVREAALYVESGFLPDHIKTPAQAVMIMQQGKELGIGPMLSLRAIRIIKGTPVLSADLMAALVLRAIEKHRAGKFVVHPPTETECTVTYQRWDWDAPQQMTFTIDDAKRAKLVGGENWVRYTPNMLRARATSNAARAGFPDVIAGIYTPEEIDPNDWVQDDARSAQDAAEAAQLRVEDNGNPVTVSEDAETDATPGEAQARDDTPVVGTITQWQLEQIAKLHDILAVRYDEFPPDRDFEAMSTEEAEGERLGLIATIRELEAARIAAENERVMTERANAAIQRARSEPRKEDVPTDPNDPWFGASDRDDSGLTDAEFAEVAAMTDAQMAGQ
jgi:hypothetical protein